MAETTPNSSSDKDEKHSKHHNHHHRIGETHGLRYDIDENTPISDVKAPNVFERAKEEIEAIFEAIHHKKDLKNHGSSSDSHPEKDVKSPNFIEKTKEEIAALIHKEKPPHRHRKETHGRSDDIDENTPIDEIKAPNVFERAKEEIEALVEAIHPKKESSGSVSKESSDSVASPKKHGGLKMSIGKGLEKICSPGSHNKD